VYFLLYYTFSLSAVIPHLLIMAYNSKSFFEDIKIGFMLSSLQGIDMQEYEKTAQAIRAKNLLVQTPGSNQFIQHVIQQVISAVKQPGAELCRKFTISRPATPQELVDIESWMKLTPFKIVVRERWSTVQLSAVYGHPTVVQEYYVVPRDFHGPEDILKHSTLCCGPVDALPHNPNRICGCLLCSDVF
jgi:hypothetical protein